MSFRSSPAGRALSAAFPLTVPIFLGFWFLGVAYGVFMHVSGFSFVYPLVMAVVIFGGSLEFIATAMLTAPFAPAQTLVVALMVQARHLFYGISMLERFKGLGWKKYYIIYAMCDETFAIEYQAKVPEGVDRGWFLFFITLLDQFYWVSGATVGGLLGPLLTFDTRGLGFVMTAMFVAIFVEQLLSGPCHIPALVGAAATLGCLAAFGPDSFLVPAMAVILLLLVALRRPLQARGLFPGACCREPAREPSPREGGRP